MNRKRLAGQFPFPDFSQKKFHDAPRPFNIQIETAIKKFERPRSPADKLVHLGKKRLKGKFPHRIVRRFPRAGTERTHAELTVKRTAPACLNIYQFFLHVFFRVQAVPALYGVYVNLVRPIVYKNCFALTAGLRRIVNLFFSAAAGIQYVSAKIPKSDFALAAYTIIGILKNCRVRRQAGNFRAAKHDYWQRAAAVFLAQGLQQFQRGGMVPD